VKETPDTNGKKLRPTDDKVCPEFCRLGVLGGKIRNAGKKENGRTGRNIQKKRNRKCILTAR